MHLQKALMYLCTKKFLPVLLYFWNYNPSPNEQIISLVGAQAHLQIQLLRAEWYKVLRIIYCRISPTEQIEEETKRESYILNFQVSCFFFAGEQYIKTTVKVSIKVQRTAGALSRVSTENVNHP